MPSPGPSIGRACEPARLRVVKRKGRLFFKGKNGFEILCSWLFEVLTEHELVQPIRPTLEEIQHYLRGASFANWTEQVQRFATAETLKSKDRKAFLRALLYPGRFCYSWMTGCMGSNDDAVAFLAKIRPARLDVSLITRALQCRQADADPDVLRYIEWSEFYRT